MSKSNGFGPGANALLNGTYFHSTCVDLKPSWEATAYVTADSYPSPLRGSETFQGEPGNGLPPNHGGYAGLSVPTVSLPFEIVGQFAAAATGASASASTKTTRVRIGCEPSACESVATTSRSPIPTSSSSPSQACPRA